MYTPSPDDNQLEKTFEDKMNYLLAENEDEKKV